MIDIPLNKALVAEEVNIYSTCAKCALFNNCRGIACRPEHRKDGKNVIFKLVDNQRDRKFIEWFVGGDSGVSSETLCACLFGILPKKKHKHHPGDPGDFGRCKRFLDLLSPEDKETVFREAAKLSREWKALIENWDLLEKMYNEHDEDLFQQMQKVIKEAP